MDDLCYIALPPQLLAIKARATELQFAMASERLVGTMLRILAASKRGGQRREGFDFVFADAMPGAALMKR